MVNIAIIVAGGIGSRMSHDLPKQFLEVNGKTILEHTLNKVYQSKNINKIIISVHNNYLEFTKNIIKENAFNNINVLSGGVTRQLSVKNALDYIATTHKKTDNINVLIHDAARPIIDLRDINRLIDSLRSVPAISIAIPSTDTLVELDSSRKKIQSVPDRSLYWRVQTPQCFRFDLIYKAHELADKDKYYKASDDNSLVLKYKLSDIEILEATNNNMKVTVDEDLEILKLYLK